MKIFFFIKDAALLKKHIAIWIQVSNSIKKELDCEPTYIKNFLKSKIRSYEDEATDLHSRKRSEIDSNYICWSVVLIDSVLKKDKSYYQRVFLKECKYMENKKCD